MSNDVRTRDGLPFNFVDGVAVGGDTQAGSLYFGSISNDPITISFSSSVPVDGRYTKGSVVYNLNPTVSGGKILLCWSRLTTGELHSIGVDWSPFYGTVS